MTYIDKDTYHIFLNKAFPLPEFRESFCLLWWDALHMKILSKHQFLNQIFSFGAPKCRISRATDSWTSFNFIFSMSY